MTSFLLLIAMREIWQWSLLASVGVAGNWHTIVSCGSIARLVGRRARIVTARLVPTGPSRREGGAAPPKCSWTNVEQSYLSSLEKLLALSLIAFVAILGPFHPMISSVLSSSSSVAMKNFSSSC
jgi:hypothetical protein